MSSIVYPRQITKNIYDVIGSNFSTKQFVKINTLRDNTCVYEYNSEHEGTTVLKGEKIGINIWLTDKQ